MKRRLIVENKNSSLGPVRVISIAWFEGTSEKQIGDEIRHNFAIPNDSDFSLMTADGDVVVLTSSLPSDLHLYLCRVSAPRLKHPSSPVSRTPTLVRPTPTTAMPIGPAFSTSVLTATLKHATTASSSSSSPSTRPSKQRETSPRRVDKSLSVTFLHRERQKSPDHSPDSYPSSPQLSPQQGPPGLLSIPVLESKATSSSSSSFFETEQHAVSSPAHVKRQLLAQRLGRRSPAPSDSGALLSPAVQPDFASLVKKTKNTITVEALSQLMDAVTQNASQVDLKALASRAGEQCRSLMACDKATVFVVDEVSNTLWSPDEMAPGALSLVQGGLAGYVARTGQSVRLPSDPITAGTLDCNPCPEIPLDSERELLGYTPSAVLAVPVPNPDDNQEVLAVIYCARTVPKPRAGSFTGRGSGRHSSPLSSPSMGPLSVDVAVDASTPTAAAAGAATASSPTAGPASPSAPAPAAAAPAGPGYTRAPFLLDDHLLLRVFACHLGIHIRNIKLYEAAIKMETQYNALVELVSKMPKGCADPTFVSTALHTVQELVDADRCSLFLADPTKQTLVARDANTGEEVAIGMDKGIIGYAARSGKTVNVPNVTEDERFNAYVDFQTGYRTHNLLCAPIFDEEGSVLGATSFVNHRGGSAPFSKDEEDLVRTFCRLTSLGLRFPMIKRSLATLREKLTTISQLSSVVVGQEDFGEAMRRLMASAQEVLCADRCSLFLLDKSKNELWAKLDDSFQIRFSILLGLAGHAARTGELVNVADATKDPRFYAAIDKKTGYKTCTLLCVPVRDPSGSVIGVMEAVNKLDGLEFDHEDEETLALLGNLAAVLLLRRSPRLDDSFEDLNLFDVQFSASTSGPAASAAAAASSASDAASPSSSSSSSSLAAALASRREPVRKVLRSNSHPGVTGLLESVSVFDLQKASAHPGAKGNTTMLELLGKHKNFGKITHLFDFEGRSYSDFSPKKHLSLRTHVDRDYLASWDYNALKLSPDEIMCHLIFMFEELGFSPDLIPLEKLCTLVDNVSCSYRANPYHNFRHALDTTQAIYAFLASSPTFREYLPPLDRLALLVAAFCHDVDHPGVTSDFLIKTSSPLAVFYNDESVLENYHCSVAFLLLRHHESDIFANLSKDERKLARSLIIANIMATDMSRHFRYIEAAKERVTKLEQKAFQTDSVDDRKMLSIMSMKCADLVHLVRPFPVAEEWEVLIQQEFFLQGDLEKEHKLPIGPCNDRDTVDIAASQVFFYKTFGTPLFSALCGMVPDVEDRLATLQSNCSVWAEKAALNKRLKEEAAAKKRQQQQQQQQLQQQ